MQGRAVAKGLAMGVGPSPGSSGAGGTLGIGEEVRGNVLPKEGALGSPWAGKARLALPGCSPARTPSVSPQLSSTLTLRGATGTPTACPWAELLGPGPPADLPQPCLSWVP